MARLMVAPLLLGLAAPAFAQDEFRDGRLRYLEPGVLTQRGGETGAEEAFANLPFLPGDRLWTDASGRAELQFGRDAFVRLDNRSKLDYLSQDQGRRNDRILLRLSSGGVYFRVDQSRDTPDFELETPGGLVEFLERGVYRVDVEAGETRLSVYDGRATLDSGGRRVSVDSGERTYARRDEEPERARPFDREGDFDEFASWDQEREDRVAWAGGSERYLPEEVSYYGGELDESGSWYYEAEVGHVWRPYVNAGWRPYLNGHWAWTYYGWTWVPYEPWGWATFHYGRWGYSPVIGWYWIPGASWGPAWVSWAVGGDYVGWCPLGYRDRPVIVHESRVKGHAVPRGSLPAQDAETSTSADAGGFVFVKKTDMGSRLVAERRFAVQGDAARSLHIADSPRLRPTRELRLSDAVPAGGSRTIKTRPSFGDTVPELRDDPATTIPLRSWQPDRNRVQPSDRRDSLRPAAGERPTDLRSPRTPATGSQISGAERARPTDLRSPRVPLTRSLEGGSARRPIPAVPEEERPRTLRPSSDSSRPDSPTAREPNLRDRGEAQPRREPDHDVLRRFFQPLSQGRPRGEEAGPRSVTPRSEPRSLGPGAPSRSEPRRAAPAPPPPQKIERAQPKPKREKQN